MDYFREESVKNNGHYKQLKLSSYRFTRSSLHILLTFRISLFSFHLILGKQIYIAPKSLEANLELVPEVEQQRVCAVSLLDPPQQHAAVCTT